MPRAHGACGARTLWHCWVLDFNNFIARVQDKVAAAECRRAFLKCEIDQKLRPQSAGGHFLSAGSDSARGLPPRPCATFELVAEWPETPGRMRAVHGPAGCGGEEAGV
jgi:hypothetical protein